MTTIKQISTYDEDTYRYDGYAIMDGEIEVGSASAMVDEKSAYIDRIDIFDGHRGQGHGTAALEALHKIYGYYLISPDNEDARRLYERLGSEVTSKYPEYDQGHGVYEI